MVTLDMVKGKAEEVASALHFTEGETAAVLNLIRRIEENLSAGSVAAAKVDVDQIGTVCSGKAWSDYQIATMNEFRSMLEGWVTESENLPTVEFEGPMGRFYSPNEVSVQALVKGAVDIVNAMGSKGVSPLDVVRMIRKKGGQI